MIRFEVQGACAAEYVRGRGGGLLRLEFPPPAFCRLRPLPAPCSLAGRSYGDVFLARALAPAGEGELRARLRAARR